MEEAKDPELTAKLVELIREGDVEGIKAELTGVDDVDIALVSRNSVFHVKVAFGKNLVLWVMCRRSLKIVTHWLHILTFDKPEEVGP